MRPLLNDGSLWYIACLRASPEDKFLMEDVLQLRSIRCSSTTSMVSQMTALDIGLSCLPA